MVSLKDRINCCCSCGIKLSICILKDMINMGNLIDNYTIYYGGGSSSGQLLESKYPNFILIQEPLENNQTLNINICLENLNYIKIEPTGGSYSSVINVLNKYYVSPFVIHPNCVENCCCKDSSISYLKDKYMESDLNGRQFRIQLNDNNYVIPEGDSTNVTVIHMDYDVVWLLNQANKVIYLVSICKICSLIDTK